MVAYEGSEPFVFVSYSHKDKNQVLPIIEGLQKRNFRVWYDKRGISAGSEWAEVIAEHLENCSCMVAFASQNFGESVNCREELNFAKELKKTILVVYLEDWQNLRASMRMRLGALHALNLDDYPDSDALLQELSGVDTLQLCLAAAAEATKPAEPSLEELYRQAELHYDRKEYEGAVQLYRKAAEQGYAPSQHRLGWCYDCGEGVPQNGAEAVKWYRKAAEQGNAPSQFNLGVCYARGEGVHQNEEEAVKWYRKAAEQGDEDAQFNLGVCYARGEGVHQNEEEAVKWYLKAAEQKHAPAQVVLGLCYEGGKGVPQNYRKAVKWHSKAAEQRQAVSQCELGTCFYWGRGVLTNKKKAVKWYLKAAEQGLAKAQFLLAFCYEFGEGVQRNTEEARKWYQKAADQGYEPAIEALKTL